MPPTARTAKAPEAEADAVENQPLDLPDLRVGRRIFNELAADNEALFADWHDAEKFALPPIIDPELLKDFNDAALANSTAQHDDQVQVDEWIEAAHTTEYDADDLAKYMPQGAKP